MALPLLLWFSACAALLGSVLYGYHLGVLNTSLTAMAADLGFSEGGGGAVVTSAVVVGACFGSLLAGQLANRCGTKVATIINTLPLLAGGVVCTIATGLWAMVAGRVLAGWGSGMASVLTPRYLSEIAPTSIRGALGTLTQISVNVGILAAFAAGLPLESGRSAAVTVLGHEVPWWRVMLALSIPPALLQALAMALCPESPAWLLCRGRRQQAAKSFKALHGEHFNPADHAKLSGENCTPAAGSQPTDAEQPLLEERHSTAVHSAGSEQLGWMALYQPRYRRAMLLAGALPLLQQMSGINTVIFYSSTVFKQAGLKSPVLGSILMGLDNVVLTVVAAVLMDRAGRKALMTTSFAGMAACLGLMSAVMALPTGLPQAGEGLVSLISILAYILFFALGAGPIPFLYLPEVLPQEILGNAQAFCTSLNFVSNLAVAATFPAMLSSLGIAGSYALYTLFNLAGAWFAARLMLETKQRSLEEIRAELLQGHE